MSTPAPGSPTPPIDIAGGAERAASTIAATTTSLDERFLRRLAGVCAEVSTAPATVAEASRDWWPLAMVWATQGRVASRAGAVARPSTPAEVAEIARVCHDARVPLVAAGGRSGVCGAVVPVHGGVVCDLTELSGVIDVDDTSLVLDVAAGTFGAPLELELQGRYGVTVGHWPQSMDVATVGGWLACRGAGQYSTRYGKVEDIVIGLDVVLADGRTIRTGGQPRQAVGPDLNQLFVGSEGTLGIITSARLRLHPRPVAERRAAYTFDRFDDGLEACRRILRRGGTPAVLRLHDTTEATRFGVEGKHLVIALDEGDALVIDAAMQIVDEECRNAGGRAADAEIVASWLEHRNDVAALEALITKGYVVDTMEVAGPWATLPNIHRAACEAIAGVEGTLVASCHESHAYSDGACLYFTFAAKVPPERRDSYYREAWEAGTRAVLANGGALSHHHGVGLNRSRFVREALGPAFDVLVAAKAALDPVGILNPGKLGLPSPFGDVAWP